MIVTDLAGTPVALLPERAIWRDDTRTLLVADLHLGKAASFRARGVPVPEQTTGADLARLTALIRRHDARRLLILGDLLHARAGRAPGTMREIASWRRRHAALEMLLVRGNHDRRAGDPPPEWDITTVTGPHHDDALVLSHEPESHPDGFMLCGHLHPAVRLHGAARASMRTRCFWVRSAARMCVLPAFGSFTGSKAIAPDRRDRVFAVGDDRVVELKPRSRSLPARARDRARQRSRE